MDIILRRVLAKNADYDRKPGGEGKRGARLPVRLRSQRKDRPGPSATTGSKNDDWELDKTDDKESS